MKSWSDIREKHPDIPVLIGFLSDWDTIKVWCPFCNKFHTHGFNEEKNYPMYGGHRVKHCGTIFVNGEVVKQVYNFENGYFIKIVEPHILEKSLKIQSARARTR